MKKYIIKRISKQIKCICLLDDHIGIYEGEYINNKMHGFGKFTFNDGYVYEGIFENGKRIEYGKLYFPLSDNIVMYEGFFNEDFNCDKYGKIIYKNGNIYEGQWCNGYFCGVGKMIYYDSKISITANWVDENNYINPTGIKVTVNNY